MNGKMPDSITDGAQYDDDWEDELTPEEEELKDVLEDIALTQAMEELREFHADRKFEEGLIEALEGK